MTFVAHCTFYYARLHPFVTLSAISGQTADCVKMRLSTSPRHFSAFSDGFLFKKWASTVLNLTPTEFLIFKNLAV